MMRHHVGAWGAVLGLTLSLNPIEARALPQGQSTPETAGGGQTTPTSLPLPDLKGWVVERATVESSEGAITILAGGGWVRTARPLADFTFVADVKPQVNAEADIVIRAWPTFSSTNAPADGSFIPVTSNPANATGWRHVEIEVAGDMIRGSVDGMEVPALSALRNPQGFLALYVANGSAQFKNTRLERRPAKPLPGRDGVFSIGAPGLTFPKLLSEKRPSYSSDAMRRRIQGTVMLSLVVGVDGQPRDISVMQSLDPESGLDRAAIDAARQWRFTPGTRDGVAVPVAVTMEMSFSLR